MNPSPSKITIHMVSSLDGFIAKKNNDMAWFETTDRYEKGTDAEDAEQFMKTIDCFVMGARTYEHAFELSKSFGWAYSEVPVVVLTHRELPVDRESVRFCSGDLLQVVNEQLKPLYNNIWVVGGAELVSDFIRLNLADDIRMTILPIILGDGLPFFNNLKKEQALHLIDAIAYKSGMIELCYEIR